MTAALGALLIGQPVLAQEQEQERAETWAPWQGEQRHAVRATVDSLATVATQGREVAGMVVAVVQGVDTLAFRAYGWADLERQAPISRSDVFEIGSITKQFTAAAILQLQDQGHLSLDDLVSEYLRNSRFRSGQITLRHLLHHTSGIPDFTELPDFGGLVSRGASLDSIVRLFSDAPLLFPPGEAMAYSNSGYVLLGLVIEAVTGMSYRDFVENNLFTDAGMASSSYCGSGGADSPAVRGHGASVYGLLPTEPLDHVWPYAAGSLCSSAGDLIAWNRALHGGRILSADAYRTLTEAGSIRDGTGLRYAAGLMIDSVAGRPAIHHGGSLPGFRTELMYFPEDDLSIAVLTNTSGSLSPFALAEQIATTVYGRWTPPVSLLEYPASEYVGEYRGVGRSGRKRVFIGAEGPARLFLRRDDGPAMPLIPTSAGRFLAGRVRVTFFDTPTGISQLRLDEVGENAVLTRVR